jgi:hypothetical protein
MEEMIGNESAVVNGARINSRLQSDEGKGRMS